MLKDRANGFNSLQNIYRRQYVVDKGFIQRPLIQHRKNFIHKIMDKKTSYVESKKWTQILQKHVLMYINKY